MSPARGLTGPLGIGGWIELDPVLLAALVTEAPVLLVGPHGTAKTLLVQRLGAALGLELRHYNASLLNYDDLVGIPLPDEDGGSLRFVTLPAAVWDAEFVFFDELSRCRPDLANKLFPIVHERMVQGLRLDRLRHRWAAMNPPPPSGPDAWDADGYIGTEALDPALADRFPYVVSVPGWKQLSRDTRLAIADPSEPEPAAGDRLPWTSQLVTDAAAALTAIRASAGTFAAEYAVGVVDLLADGGFSQSPRRSRMLAEAVVAVHAAAAVLGVDGSPVEFADSAFLALRNCLPQTATAEPPAPADLLAVHRQAFEMAASRGDLRLHAILCERDPLRRVVMADEAGCDDATVSRFVTGALAAAPTEGRRLSVATALFLRMRDRRNLDPAAWEPLGSLAARVLTPRDVVAGLSQGAELRLWEDVNRWLTTEGAGATNLDRNFVLTGTPSLWVHEDWRGALAQFRADMAAAGVAEVAA